MNKNPNFLKDYKRIYHVGWCHVDLKAIKNIFSIYRTVILGNFLSLFIDIHAKTSWKLIVIGIEF